jgi:Cytochrome P460
MSTIFDPKGSRNSEGVPIMKWIILLLVVAAAVAGVVASTAHASGHADENAAPIFGIKIYPGYRDWRLVSVAHEEGNLNDIRAILGNDVAIKAFREDKLPFPDGTVIARIAWKDVPSEENNKVFGRNQSFVAGPAPEWYLQFMVKNSIKYAATAGWGFAQFDKRRQTRRRSDAQNLLSLSRANQSSRLCFYALRTLKADGAYAVW